MPDTKPSALRALTLEPARMVAGLVKYVLGKDNPGEWMILFTAVSFVAQTISIPAWT